MSLVNDLLDISKIEAGKLDLTFVAVPLNDLVRECDRADAAAGEPRAHLMLRSSLSREVPAIVADQRSLRQIVLNLLSNSVKFTGPGGQVIVSTSLAESGEALLRIRDTGEGMSEEELATALKPFRQIATADARPTATGTGLGLPLTKALVEANRASFVDRQRAQPGDAGPDHLPDDAGAGGVAALIMNGEELAVVRRAYAMQIAAAGRVTDPRVVDAFATIRREDFLGPGPWPIYRFWEGYVASPSADPVYLYTNDLIGISTERHINNGEPSLHAWLLARATPRVGRARRPCWGGPWLLFSDHGASRRAERSGDGDRV